MQYNWKLTGLAAEFECTPGTLSDVERGKRKPSGSLAAQIERRTGIVMIDWFPAETPAQTEGRGE